ncbi:MAG: exonuclease SbcCD subunit D [Vulcanibacillus sp.]
MSSIKFIHAADLHLDSPFKGLIHIPENIYKEIQNSTFQAYDKIIEYCIEHKVDFLLLSGDIFDLEERSIKAQIYFLKGLEKLNNYGIKVYLIHGNHDPLDDLLKTNVKWPANVYSFSSEKVEEHIFSKDNVNVASIYGRSYPNKAFKENIVQDYIVRDTNLFNIGLLHTNVDGNKEHDSYAPTTLSELKKSAIDYWALGHIHKGKILSDKAPTIVYSGNPQGRNIKETGLKGCLLVEVDKSNISSIKWLTTSRITWEQFDIDISETESYDQLVNVIESKLEKLLFNSEFPLIVRINVLGRSDLHFELHKDDKLEEIQEILNKLYSNQSKWLLVESIKLNTKPLILIDQVLEQDSFLADFFKEIEEFKKTNIETNNYEDIGSELFNNRSIRKYLSEFSEDDLEDIYEQVKSVAIEYLLEEEK